MVLDYRFWQQEFGGDPSVVGQVVRVQGIPLTIVGVTEPMYEGLRMDVTPDVTVPLQLLDRLLGRTPNPARPLGATLLVGRLADGVTIERARTEVDTLWPSIQEATVPTGFDEQRREEFLSMHVEMTSVETGVAFGTAFVGNSQRSDYASVLLTLLALTVVLLAIACINLSGLLLTRAASRAHELRIRLAVGASRARLIQELVVQGMLLAILGSTVALPVAWFGTEAIGQRLWTNTTMRLAPDLFVILVSAAVAIAVGTTVSLVPAWAVSRQSAGFHVRGGRGMTLATRRLTRTLLVSQVALSFMLVAGAGLLLRSVSHLWNTDPGFRVEGLWVARLTAQPGGYRDIDKAAYYPQLVAQLSSIPGVQGASLARLFPYAGDSSLLQQNVSPGGPLRAEEVAAGWDIVSPGFFRTAGITLLEGRDFDWTDGIASPRVAIINRALARRLFPSDRAVGQTISLGSGPAQGSCEIVGIVADATLGDTRAEHLPVVYRPWLQGEGYTRSPVAQLRTTSDISLLRDRLRETSRSLGVEYVLEDGTAAARLRRALAREEVAAGISSVAGGLALLIAGIGLYGALAYSVTLRTSEIAVRMALGATHWSVFRVVAREGLLVSGLGIVFGLVGALAATRYLESLLFGVTPADPATFVMMSLLFLGAACFACYIPARRATRIDPMAALRRD